MKVNVRFEPSGSSLKEACCDELAEQCKLKRIGFDADGPFVYCYRAHSRPHELMHLTIKYCPFCGAKVRKMPQV